MESFCERTEAFMKASFVRTKLKEKEFTNGLTENALTVNEKITKSMAKGFLHGRVAENMKDNIKTT